ncbi:MAG: UDP-N-acetylmuramoyl-L-alanine--D-glutamate ligase [Alphaproteobacteria bacterium]|nr:UDP-N-acetylmuramoyl-L-alanine--D-glutamate ligase [Alphaproteobacteria bacterium]
MLWKSLNDKVVGIWGMGREGTSARHAIEKYVQNPTLVEITEDNLPDLLACDIVVKSPGVSLYRPEIAQARKKGVRITSGTNLFFANKNKTTKVIAVTGTKGKSTTAALTAHTLRSFGFRTELGGNFGVPLLDLVETDVSFVVAELSSYQCADFSGAPDIGILVNLYPEHLQWHGSHERYYADKLHMIRQCKTAVANGADKRIPDIKAVPFNTPAGFHVEKGMFCQAGKPLFATDTLSLIGAHNAENACAVLAVMRLLGLNLERCAGAFATFKALPHRLQTIGTIDGRAYVDDSISTTPETAIAALKAIDKGQHITIIVGGQDRGQTYAELSRFLVRHKDRMRVVALPDTGGRIRSRALKIVRAKTMAEAVAAARKITRRGGTILLSPAAPSYNLFRNFEERGEAFRKCAFG